MNKMQIFNGLSRKFYKLGFSLKKHSPEILVGVSIVSGIAGTIAACKATTKLDTVIEPAKNDLELIRKRQIDAKVDEDTATEKECNKALTVRYIRTGYELAKLYAPAVGFGAISVVSVLSATNIMNKRYSALTAAYTVVDNGFKNYRSRVVERFGEKVDKELKYNIKAKEVEEVTIDENGEAKVTKKTVEVADVDTYSQYSRIFDETCTGWVKDAEQNKFFLHQVEKWANQELKYKGILFLNEVYERLGFKRTAAGQEVGWVYDPENPDHQGDNHVDFGIYDCYTGNETVDEPKRAFINGYERSIIIDFNVDGPVHHLLK